jgi:DNA-directed RNA polymerase specialized sigma24 family protein
VRAQLKHRFVTNPKSDYATCEEFCKLFAENVRRLYLLSFLLTANPEMAEQCFVTGLDDCVNGISVFQESADCWARRVIVRRAVRLVQPRRGDTEAGRHASTGGDENLSGTALREQLFAGVLALQDFERFAFVLSVLEGYPDQSCAIFLGASRQEVREARRRAFDYLAHLCSPRMASLC